MIEIFLYAIGIMYTPGPMNLLGLNLGINKKFKESIGFFVGIGLSMLLLFLMFGYTGEKFIRKEYLVYISIFGSIYILYLAFKILKANIDVKEQKNIRSLSFKDGFLMQTFNPKATLATLPIATINFPANNITGTKILFVSLILSLLAFLAPCSYSFIGEYFSALIKKDRIIKAFNTLMALLLIYVAYTIFRDHVYLVFMGINTY